MAVVSTPPPDLADLIRLLASDGQLVHLERLPARAARTAELTEPLPPVVAQRLPVPSLWTHQAAAIDHLRAGRSVALATGTASGKTLAYQVPIVEAVSTGLHAGTALLLFPTKALAQDQLRSLGSWDAPRLVPATYDGDTPTERRTWVRSNANVILTNPEMLHHGVLPHHARWATFLMRLRYVVVDELHTMRGIFGTHVAHLLRRLRRLCQHYGADPTFVFCSATIGTPGRLASELCGLDVAEVTDDGSPRGERLVALWNPAEIAAVPVPVARNGTPVAGADLVPRGAGAVSHHDHRRRSANTETADLTAAFVAEGHRTIAFCRSRKGAELVATMVRRRLPRHLEHTVRSYRGGYLAAERREIEAELFDGSLRGVVATTALELGVDIGGLDACVLNGFPGTIASMWQQAGRAGRSAQESIAVLVAGDDQLDQWYVAHPNEVFTRPPERAVINLTNPNVLLPHLACAAYELPLTWFDERWWPGMLDDGVRELVTSDLLRLRRRRPTDPPRAVWAGRGWPAHVVDLRSSGADEFRIATDDGTLIGTVEGSRAFRQVHPGAVYLHQGQPFRVRALHIDDLVALVEPTDGGEYTQPRSDTDVTLLTTEATEAVGRIEVSLGQVKVRSQVVGYRRFDTESGALLGTEELDLPPGELVTRAFWFTVSADVLDAAGIVPGAVPGTLHAVEHAAIGMMPLFTICDRWDVGGVSTPLQPELGHPAILVYDGHPGGAGIAELGFASALDLLAATRDLIDACSCTHGCPSCVQSPKCGNGNEPLDKAGAAALLHHLLR
jgi:DEAD/DEAH box helicase domain-containing protein